MAAQGDAAGGRQFVGRSPKWREAMTIRPRMKLSDVEATQRYLFRGEPTSFEKAFPNVETLRIEVWTERIWENSDRPHIYNQDNIVPVINCTNPRCYGGGLNIQEMLRYQVIDLRLTKYEGRRSCTGYEGSPKGRRRTGSCDTSYRIAVEVTYKASTSSS